ncbi:MAG: hypothetical protein ACOX9R_05680 [Armatimonadota bacterium]|jgi:hypothetical protein
MTATTMLMLTLILNGGEPMLSNPIISDVDADGARQIAIPVRDVFEAAGYVVQYWDREQPHVDIIGHADRLPEGRHLMRKGVIHLDRAEVRSDEHVAALPFPVRSINGTLYAPAIVMRIIGGGDLRADLDAQTLHWDTYPPERPPVMTVAEIVSDLPRWLHRRVRIEGTFHGSDVSGDGAAATIGAPAPGAWVVADGTGAIHCTDAVWIGWLFTRTPELARDLRVAVEGVVRPGWGGIPYLSNANAISDDAA